MTFSEEEKQVIDMAVKQELLKIERQRFNHEMIITTNKGKPKLDDENKQKERDLLIDQHVKVVEMYTKQVDLMEGILKKLDG